MRLRFAMFILPFLLGVACTKNKDTAASDKQPVALSPEQQTDELIAKGKSVYSNHCTACHAPQPDVAGAVGPAIAGSSKELVEARILNAAYPEGYTPKRATKAMPAMPYLKRDLDAITAYLQSIRPK